MEIFSNLGAAFAVGFACIGVAIGQGYLTMKAMKTIGRNPKMHTFYLTIAILGIALVESAAIYGLIMGFQILTSESISTFTALGIGFAVGLSGLGVGIGEGKMVEGAFNAMNKDPENKNKLMTYMILFLALIESAAIYGLVVGYQLLSGGDILPIGALAAGLAIGLSGLGVAIGEGILAKKCLEVISLDRKNAGFYLTLGVLGIALVESAAIYGLIVAFNIISLNPDNFGIIGAALAVGIGAIGVGIGEGKMISGSLEAIKNNPKNKAKILTYMILFVALIESAAIYGLIVAFGIISSPEILNIGMIGAGLAIGLAGLGVAIGESFVAKSAIENISKDEKNTNFYLTLAILGIALVESAAIYGLIISLNIISNPEIGGVLIGAGFAIGLAGLGVGIGEGKMVSGAINGVLKNPKIKSQLLTYMILFLALIESAAIYGLIVSFQIISVETLDIYIAIAIGLTIGLAGLGVGIGEGLLANKSLESVAKDSKNQKFYLVSTILFIALVESAAIYALVMSFQLFQNAQITFAGLGIAASVGLAGLGVGIAEGILSSKSLEMMGENPKSKNMLLTITILGIALVESVAIYGLIIGFQIIGTQGLDGFSAIAMGLAIGLTGLGVAYGEGKLVQATISSIAHHPEQKNKLIPFMVLFLALIESAAIYGLVIAFQIFSSGDVGFGIIGVALAVGLAGLGVGIGEGLLANKSIQYIANDYKNSSFYLVVTILSIALVESAAIYGLIISVQLLSTVNISDLGLIGAGLAIGLTGLGVGIGEGYMVRGALDSIRLNPKYRKKILVYMILFIALVESVAIYGLVVSTQILTQPDLIGVLAIAGALSIGLGGIGVAIGEGFLLHNALDVIGKNPKFQSLFLTTSILSVALVESAAIYSLVIAFEILGFDPSNTLITLGAGISVGLAALGAGIGEGMLSWGTLSSMYRNPHEKSRDLAFMVLFIALIEVLAIYGLIVSLQILS